MSEQRDVGILSRPHSKRSLRQCNLIKLYNQVVTGVEYCNFLQKLEIDEHTYEDVENFAQYITKLFIRVCSLKLVSKHAGQLTNETAKAKSLRAVLSDPIVS